MQVSKKTQQTSIKKEKTKQFSLIQIFYIFVSVVCIFCEALLSSGLHEASSTVAIEMFFICYHCVIWSTEKKKKQDTVVLIFIVIVMSFSMQVCYSRDERSATKLLKSEWYINSNTARASQTTPVHQ